MVNTGIRLITFLAAKDGEDLYSQQKQDQESTVAQIMNSLLKILIQMKKVEKTTRTSRHDLIQLPNDYIREGNGNPLKYCCLENPMDGGAW